MTNPLVVNPYLQFQPFTDDNSAFDLTAPKPGEGLLTTTISRSERANIFEVFSDLSTTRFDFLDAAKDFNEGEREFLFENGVLVNEEAKPERPLFSCKLEDLNEYAGEMPQEELMVNPGFRFEPLNLTNFAGLSQKNLSPFGSIGWTAAPVTGIENGWWISSEHAADVSHLRRGEQIVGEIDESLLRRLLTSEVVGTRRRFEAVSGRWTQMIAEARDRFALHKYAVFPAIFPSAQMAAMRRYYRQYVSQGFMPFGDPQVERRYRQHNEPFASFIHGQLADLVSMVVGEPVQLSYVYAASYKDGSVLAPHTDREQCEFSISFQVDYEPEPPGHLSPWTIYVEPLPETVVPDKNGFSFTLDQLETHRNVQPTGIHLASGDGLIYKGRELIHYRDVLPSGHRSTSLFFHFVAVNFRGSLN